ncbi:UBC9-like protein, partial [Mya arenaria]
MATKKDESMELQEFLRTRYSSCMFCSGYYGNSFGEPKADSGDSGNEEPDMAQDFCERPMMPSSAAHARATREVSHKMDRLAERIGMLTIPRERDNIPEGLVDSLPPEVLLVVFKYLDDISLWTAGMVCPRWQQLLQGETTETRWHEFIKLRWPLFSPNYKVKNWKTIYTKLLESSPCRYCLESMMLQSTPPIEENSWRHRRLRSELKTLKSDPPEGIRAEPLDRHCCHWQASITGPQGSPFEGGLFLLYLQIPDSRHGDVGLDSIHYNWSLALTISKVLISIQSLLTDPYCDVCMEPTIGTMYKKNHGEFDRIARLWTWKYAMHDFLMPMDIDLN